MRLVHVILMSIRTDFANWLRDQLCLRRVLSSAAVSVLLLRSCGRERSTRSQTVRMTIWSLTAITAGLRAMTPAFLRTKTKIPSRILLQILISRNSIGMICYISGSTAFQHSPLQERYGHVINTWTLMNRIIRTSAGLLK